MPKEPFPPVAGRFEKVAFAQYASAAPETDQSLLRERYESIPLPRRSTAGSAGYDFFADRDYEIPPQGSAVISTGICCRMRPGWFLALYPRSGMGFRYGVRLANTVGVIDGDFIDGETGGHILVKLVNRESGRTVRIARGDRFCQGVFQICGLAEGDEAGAGRTGGFGSTGS